MTWSIVDPLLGRGQRACDGVSADDLSTFFSEKVERIGLTTSGSAPRTFCPTPSGAAFTQFAPLLPDDVSAAIARLSDKSSVTDPLPVHVLKDVSDVFTPFLMHLYNQSLSTGCVPASFKYSFVTPILKKTGLDKADPSSYRPISNLSVISKMLEHLVARQLVTYLDANRLLPSTHLVSGEGTPQKLQLSTCSQTS